MYGGPYMGNVGAPMAPYMPYQQMYPHPQYGYMPMHQQYMPPMMCMPQFAGPIFVNHHYNPQSSAAFPATQQILKTQNSAK